MKRIVSYVLMLLLCLGLCACNSSDVGTTLGGNVDTKKQDDNIPSNALLLKDLEEALLTKNEYATVTDYETVKSLTGDGSYEITLNVYAETKYADWKYEVDMNYRMYDQGWMVDDINWVSENYEQIRLPSADTMQAYAKEYIMSREDYYDEYFLSVENGEVNLDPGSNILFYFWDALVDHNYYASLWHITSQWEYNANIDNWELLPNTEQGSLGYQVKDKWVRNIPSEELDLTGIWTYGFVPYIAEFEFSNFSLDSCDVRILGFIDTAEHFIATDTTPKGANEYTCHYAFVNENMEYITVAFSQPFIDIYYYNGGDTAASCGRFNYIETIS